MSSFNLIKDSNKTTSKSQKKLVIPIIHSINEVTTYTAGALYFNDSDDLIYYSDGLQLHALDSSATVIDSLPFVINTPGEYVISSNLTYSDLGNGIIINTGGVSIDGTFHTASLALAGDTITQNIGILINGPTSGENKLRNFTIKNLTVDSLVTTPNPPTTDPFTGNPTPAYPTGQTFSSGIWIVGASNVTIKNCVSYRTTYGIRTLNVDGLFVDDTEFIDNYGMRDNSLPLSIGAGFLVGEDTNNAIFTNCKFNGQAIGQGLLTSFGILNELATERVSNIKFTSCQFNDSDSAIHPIQCDNFTIDECNIQCSNTIYSQFQIGVGFADTYKVNNFICRNTNVSAACVLGSYATLLGFVLGQGALVQNVNFKFNGADTECVVSIGGGLFQAEPFKYDNLVFDNITIQGENVFGFITGNSDGIVVKNSHIAGCDFPFTIGSSNATFNAPPFQCLYNDFDNNQVNGTAVTGSVGFFMETARGCNIKNNTIRNFEGAVFFGVDGQGNLVQNNTITGNNNTIVGNTGQNDLVANVSYNNPNIYPAPMPAAAEVAAAAMVKRPEVAQVKSRRIF